MSSAMMQSSHVDGVTYIQSPSLYVRSQHGRPPSDEYQNSSSYSPTMSTAMIHNYGSTSNPSEQISPRQKLEKNFVPQNCLDNVFVTKSKTSECGKDNLLERSSFPHSLEGEVNNTTEINESCNANFERKCSNKVVLNESLEMQVQECDSVRENRVAGLLKHDANQSHLHSSGNQVAGLLKHDANQSHLHSSGNQVAGLIKHDANQSHLHSSGNQVAGLIKHDANQIHLHSSGNQVAGLIKHDANQSHLHSIGNEELSNDGKGNPVNGSDIIPDTANSACTSDDGSDGPSQDTYDHNSWILYGDSKISAKNSWVLYGNSQSPPNQRSKQESEAAQRDDNLSVEASGDNFDENVTDSGSEQTVKDKESTYEDLFKESRPHACTVCSKRFKLSHHLKEHMRIHTGEKPFPCPMCGERFSRSHLLRAHQARHAQDSFPSVGTIFPCSKCMKIFESPQHLARHEKNHVQSKIHKCDVCDKQFAHLVLLKKHKLQHVSRNSDGAEKSPLNSSVDLGIKQEPDDKDTANSGQLDSQDEGERDLQVFKKRCTSLSSEHNLPTKENKPLVNNVLGGDHKMGATEKKSPTVSEEKTLYDQSSWVLYGDSFNKDSACATMKERQQMNNSESDGNTSASGYKGNDTVKLDELYMATNRSLFNRNGLMSPFYSMFEFNRHALMSLIDHTAMNSSSVLPLSYVGEQSFKTESSFADHSRPHQCPHCSKRFKLSHHLREHLRIHTGEKPYHCDVCQERFSRSHLLQRHKTKHVADLTFHQVTDWIQKTSVSSCDGNANNYNEMSDRFFLSHQEQCQKLGNESNTNICMAEHTPANSSIANTQTNVKNHFSHSSDHRHGDNDLNCTKSNSGSEQALKHLYYGDDEQSKCNEDPEPVSHNVQPYQCIKTSDKPGHTVQGIDGKSSTIVRIPGLDSSDSTDGLSGMVHKSNSGISGTFQKTTFIDGITESDHKPISVMGIECVVPKMNVKSSSVVGVSGMDCRTDTIEGVSGKDCFSDCIDGDSRIDHQSNSIARSRPVFTNTCINSQENHSDDVCTDTIESNGFKSKQSEAFSDQKNMDKSIHDNNDIQANTYFNAVPSTSKDEGSVHSPLLKSQTPLVTVHTESTTSEPSKTNYTSNFQLNQSLVNNNINMFNTGYLNYTHNLQQAMSSAAFRSYHDGDPLALDIPSPDFLQESYPSPLEYSHSFKSRRGGFMRCEFCGKLFADMNNLRQHMVSHSMDRHFSCHMCEKKFKRPHHLKEHMRIHTGEKPYICDICDEKFSRSHILQRHRMKHGPSVSSDFYAQNDFYNTCEQTHARSPEFVYDKMCSPSVSKGELEAQLSPALGSDSNSDKKAVPEVDSENMSDVADSDSCNVKKYNSVETKDCLQDFKSVLQTFLCKECGKKFANSSNLKQHMVSHFPDRLFSCSVCNKKFKRPHHLKEHSRTHTGEKPYQCNRCGERFQRSHLLMKHKEKHHSNSNYGYSMEFSPGADASTVKLNGYLGDEKAPHKSTMVPNADDSTNMSDLGESLKATDSDKGDQSGGEAVSCDVCNKEFPSEMLLTVHKRTHPGDRPHQCAGCGKHFALQYLLEVHEKSCI